MFGMPTTQKFLSIVAVLTVTMTIVDKAQGNPVKRSACQHPSQDDLRSMLSQYTDNALSFATTPGANSPPASTTCPGDDYSSGAPLELRSNCPFYSVEDTEEGRYPPTLLQAECYQCNNCLDDSRESGYHVTYMCEKLVRQVWVLRNSNVCIGGIYQYNAVQVKIPVACTCARERR
ncbi:interleukin-17C-like [Ptychodera flava]|uniref:interleukin-17C-like n=1 Tax=Ptychodera flava TaxID=63121 RepID=UPI00396A3FD5